MIGLEDQTGRKVVLPKPAVRIVSLVPSQTELLVDLDLEDQLIGVTKFCVHPAGLRNLKKIIGGTKDIKLDEVLALEPDLVVANKEENPRGLVEEIRESIPTYVSDVDDLESSMRMIADLGVLTGREAMAEQHLIRISDSLKTLQKAVEDLDDLRALYLIWKSPYMAAGTDTFISSALKRLKIDNALMGYGGKQTRYPAIAVEEMRKLNPDVVLLSSEPFPFKPKHGSELENDLPGVRVVCVDGEPFSWYGTRWVKSIPYLESLAKRLRTVV